MQFKIGDKVSLIDEKFNGFVSKIKSNNMIEVTGEDGFPFPVLKSQVIKLNPAAHNEGQEEPEEDLLPASAMINQSFQTGFYLIVSKGEKFWEVYLMNNFNRPQYLQLRQKIKGEWVLLKSKEVAGGAYTFVKSLNNMEVPEFKMLSLHSISAQFALKNEPQFKSLYLKVNPKKLITLSGIQNIAFLNSSGFAFLFNSSSFNEEEVLDHRPSAKVKEAQKNQSEADEDLLLDEIDLHIEKLKPKHQGLNNAQIIDIQIKAADRAISKAISLHRKKLILIHGKGKGVLKNEIRKLIKTQYELSYDDLEDNYGATVVYF